MKTVQCLPVFHCMLYICNSKNFGLNQVIHYTVKLTTLYVLLDFSEENISYSVYQIELTMTKNVIILIVILTK